MSAAYDVSASCVASERLTFLQQERLWQDTLRDVFRSGELNSKEAEYIVKAWQCERQYIKGRRCDSLLPRHRQQAKQLLERLAPLLPDDEKARIGLLTIMLLREAGPTRATINKVLSTKEGQKLLNAASEWVDAHPEEPIAPMFLSALARLMRKGTGLDVKGLVPKWFYKGGGHLRFPKKVCEAPHNVMLLDACRSYLGAWRTIVRFGHRLSSDEPGLTDVPSYLRAVTAWLSSEDVRRSPLSDEHITEMLHGLDTLRQISYAANKGFMALYNRALDNLTIYFGEVPVSPVEQQQNPEFSELRGDDKCGGVPLDKLGTLHQQYISGRITADDFEQNKCVQAYRTSRLHHVMRQNLEKALITTFGFAPDAAADLASQIADLRLSLVDAQDMILDAFKQAKPHLALALDIVSGKSLSAVYNQDRKMFVAALNRWLVQAENGGEDSAEAYKNLFATVVSYGWARTTNPSTAAGGDEVDADGRDVGSIGDEDAETEADDSAAHKVIQLYQEALPRVLASWTAEDMRDFLKRTESRVAQNDARWYPTSALVPVLTKWIGIAPEEALQATRDWLPLLLDAARRNNNLASEVVHALSDNFATGEHRGENIHVHYALMSAISVLVDSSASEKIARREAPYITAEAINGLLYTRSLSAQTAHQHGVSLFAMQLAGHNPDGFIRALKQMPPNQRRLATVLLYNAQYESAYSLHLTDEEYEAVVSVHEWLKEHERDTFDSPVAAPAQAPAGGASSQPSPAANHTRETRAHARGNDAPSDVDRAAAPPTEKPGGAAGLSSGPGAGRHQESRNAEDEQKRQAFEHLMALDNQIRDELLTQPDGANPYLGSLLSPAFQHLRPIWHRLPADLLERMTEQEGDLAPMDVMAALPNDPIAARIVIQSVQEFKRNRHLLRQQRVAARRPHPPSKSVP